MHARPEKDSQQGFTLAAVLVVMAAMLLMAVGVLAVVGIERKTARSFIDAKRAEWVARAGMEDVRGILRKHSANDDYLVVAQEGITREEGLEPLDLLYLARGEGGGDEVRYNLQPLFSASVDEATINDLEDSFDNLDLTGNGDAVFRVRERNDEAQLAWIPVIDDNDREVGRYAFWVEDLQGKLDGRINLGEDPTLAGERSAWPFPAPGVREDMEVSDPEVAIHALDPELTGDAPVGDLTQRFEEAQPLMLSPDSVLAAMGFEAPLERDPLTGRLIDEEARNLEENISVVGLPYDERPTVPHVRGVSEEVAGKPKLNLNELLRADREDAIGRWSEWVEEGLPRFEERKGGFPDDYLKTLAANILDYADEDGDASELDGEYRGLDSYPVISEYAIRFRWEDFERIDDEKYFVLTGTVYVELWNMSDQEAVGSMQVSYDTGYQFDLSVLAGINLGGNDILGDPEIATPTLLQLNGHRWLPPLDVTLRPNEFRVVNAGTVTYRFPTSNLPKGWVPSPIELYGEASGVAGYKMRWNGNFVDQARGSIVRRDMRIHYTASSSTGTKSRPRQRIATAIPGHSYSPKPFEYANNMGDPRMSFYIGIPMSPNKYGNYSPFRRTVRWSTIYRSDSSAKPKVYGRVLPSEWPDGGHNSAFGRVPSGIRSNGDEGDERINPDDSQWLSGVPEPVREEAPMRISNRGVFYSACEMGRAYDPVMWLPTYERPSASNQIRDGRMPTGETAWPLVNVAAPESTENGGGNTLRIGRAEHPKFEVPRDDDSLEPGRHAAHLLDLFHVGKPKSDDQAEREGNLIRVESKVNINTASEGAIRALVAGNLAQDPQLSRQLSKSHSTNDLMAPVTRKMELGTPTRDRAGDLIAEAILRDRPFASAAELASIEDEDGEKIFGNKDLYSVGDKIQWTDSAAEELFARLYEASTLRSRNFRVWVVGQSIAPRPKGSSGDPEVLAESRKVFNLFADPGERDEEGAINEESYEPMVIHENDF